MRRGYILLLALWLLPAIAPGQAPDSLRAKVIADARYLKSIYRTDEAIGRLTALLAPESFDEEILTELADCHMAAADYPSAVAVYRMLSARSPESLLYKLRLMQAHFRMKDYPGSVAYGRKVLQLDTIPAVVGYIGDAFRQMEVPDSALAYYRTALRLRPGNESLTARTANVLLMKEAWDEAIALTSGFLADHPDNPVIAPLLGVACYRKADYDGAIGVFQRLEDLGNDTYPIHYFLGQSYWHTRTMYRAGKELLAAWQIDSSDVQLAYTIAAVRAESGAPFEREVKPWLDKACEMLAPDPGLMSRIHQQYGKGYMRREATWEDAIEHYKEAYRYNPKFISALSAIAYCYERRKDYRRALQWYEKYLAVATPGTPGHDFAQKSVAQIKAELFMEDIQ